MVGGVEVVVHDVKGLVPGVVWRMGGEGGRGGGGGGEQSPDLSHSGWVSYHGTTAVSFHLL